MIRRPRAPGWLEGSRRAVQWRCVSPPQTPGPRGFPGGSGIKSLPANAGDPGLSPIPDGLTRCGLTTPCTPTTERVLSGLGTAATGSGASATEAGAL